MALQDIHKVSCPSLLAFFKLFAIRQGSAAFLKSICQHPVQMAKASSAKQNGKSTAAFAALSVRDIYRMPHFAKKSAVLLHGGRKGFYENCDSVWLSFLHLRCCRISALHCCWCPNLIMHLLDFMTCKWCIMCLEGSGLNCAPLLGPDRKLQPTQRSGNNLNVRNRSLGWQ